MEGRMDREELKRLTKEEISRRIREGVKAVIEQVLEEEMTEHLAAGYRERTPSRRGERNGHYTRDLITPAGRIAQLRVPRDREGTFLTEVFERYKRMTGEGGSFGVGAPKQRRCWRCTCKGSPPAR
jgi:putative transposase